MARTNKDYDKKKKELTESIWDILLEYGYEKMTLTIIIEKLGISRGAFYHYFKTKEECADAAAALYVEKTVSELESMDDCGQSPEVRLKQAIQNAVELFHRNKKQDDLLNQSENSVFHQKLMISFTRNMSEFYAGIIIAGAERKEFDTAYPRETAEMLLTLSNFYLDMNLFQWGAESIAAKVAALEDLANRALGTKKYIAFFTGEEKHV